MKEYKIAVFMSLILALLIFVSCGQINVDERLDLSEDSQSINTAADSNKSELRNTIDSKENSDSKEIFDMESTSKMNINNKNIIIFSWFYIDSDSIKYNEDVGYYIPIVIQGILRSAEGMQYVNIDTEIESNHNFDGTFGIYSNEKFICDANLTFMSGLDGNDFYALKIEKNFRLLERGSYIATNASKKLVPRSVTIIDEYGSLKTDLNGNGKIDRLIVKKEESGENSGTLQLYINDQRYSFVGEVFNPNYYIKEGYTEKEIMELELATRPLISVYDLDGDGTFEVLLGITWPGGDSFEILSVDGTSVTELFVWLDEEPSVYLDEKGKEYFYEDGKKIYFSSDDNEQETDKATIQTEQISEGTNENLIPNISQKSEIRTVSLSKANDLAFGLKNTRKAEALGDKVIIAADFWHRLYFGFQLFNSSYEETPEDIIKGLKDLSWHNQKDFALFVWNAEQLMKDEQEAKEKVLEIIENEVIPYWEDKEDASFSVFLVQG